MSPKASSKSHDKDTKDQILRLYNLRVLCRVLCATGGQLKCPLRLHACEMRPKLCRSVNVRERVNPISRLLSSCRNRRRRKFHSLKGRFHAGCAIGFRRYPCHCDCDVLSHLINQRRDTSDGKSARLLRELGVCDRLCC